MPRLFASRLALGLALMASLFAGMSSARNSCFKTDNYNATRGQPFVITWPRDTPTSTWDLALATADQDHLGYIARNVTTSSLVWTPPLNISDGPFTLALYWLDRNSVCYSTGFNVTGDKDAPVTDLDGPFVTRVVTINREATTVTATVASFSPGAESEATAATTITSAASTQSADDDDNNNTKSQNDDDGGASGNPDRSLIIGLSTGLGLLALILSTLTILWLWRYKRAKDRKWREARARATTTTTKDTLTDGAGASIASASSTASRSSAGANGEPTADPSEMSTTANIPELGSHQMLAELEHKPGGVGGAQAEPVELPAESISPAWQRAVRQYSPAGKE